MKKMKKMTNEKIGSVRRHGWIGVHLFMIKPFDECDKLQETVKFYQQSERDTKVFVSVRI